MVKKQRCTFSIEASTRDLLVQAAHQNNVSVSAVADMFLQIVRYVPIEQLKQISPLPALLGIKLETDHAG